MKKILTILLLIVNSLVFSQTTISVAPGNWSNTSNWSNGIPQNGGTAIVNTKIIVDQNTNKLLSIIINDTLINAGNKLTINGWVNNGVYIDTLGIVKFDKNSTLLTGNTTFYNLDIKTNTQLLTIDTIVILNDLKLSNGLFNVSGGKLILYANSKYNGRITKAKKTGNIIGNFTFQQYVDRCNGWSLYGGPFNSTLNQYADSAVGQMIYTGFPNSDYPTFGWSPNAYLWDEDSVGTGGWITPDGNDVIPRGTGFWYWNSDTVFNTSDPSIIQKWKVSTSGNIDFTIPFTFPIQYTNNGNILTDGWNLLSNPYPSTLEWYRVGKNNPNRYWDKINIDDAIYVFNTCTQNYSSFVNGIGVNGGTEFIPPFQGFYIKTNNVNPILRCNRFKNKIGAIVKNYQPLAKVNTYQQNLLRINFNDDEIVLRIDSQSNELFNNQYDAYKILSDNSTIYSKLDSILYSINTINDSTEEIPLYNNGQGTLYFSGMNSFDPQYTLYLEDKVLGTMTSLNSITSYTFTTMVPNGIYFNRFTIHLFGGIILNVFNNHIEEKHILTGSYNILGEIIDTNKFKGLIINRYNDGCSEKFLNFK